MKLLEILARDLAEWPIEAFWIGQACDGDLHINDSDNEFIRHTGDFLALADDWNTAEVKQSQWQAERDRQKGGDWKRHRGGKQPIDRGLYIEAKLRCGDIQRGYAQDFIWPHAACDVDANLMKYRVISQPQAEEVEVREFMSVTEGAFVRGPISLNDEVIYPAEAQWQQSSGPLAWRDTIIHCQAIIEDCEREIAKNENMLALEGFALIPAMTPVAGVSDVDMAGWRSWQVGDELECVFSDALNIYTVGESYTVKSIESDYAVVTDDTCGGQGTCHINDDDISDIRFIRRP